MALLSAKRSEALPRGDLALQVPRLLSSPSPSIAIAVAAEKAYSSARAVRDM